MLLSLLKKMEHRNSLAWSKDIYKTPLRLNILLKAFGNKEQQWIR